MDDSSIVVGMVVLVVLNLLAVELAMILPPAWLALPVTVALLTVVAGLVLWMHERGRGRGRRRCPACGYRARIDSRFCAMCGHFFG